MKQPFEPMCLNQNPKLRLIKRRSARNAEGRRCSTRITPIITSARRNGRGPLIPSPTVFAKVSLPPPPNHALFITHFLSLPLSYIRSTPDLHRGSCCPDDNCAALGFSAANSPPIQYRSTDSNNRLHGGTSLHPEFFQCPPMFDQRRPND